MFSENKTTAVKESGNSLHLRRWNQHLHNGLLRTVGIVYPFLPTFASGNTERE